MFYMGGYAHKDIARFLDVPVSTIKSRLYSARQKLKERLLTMVEDHLHEQAPSKDQRFQNNVIMMLPDEFDGPVSHYGKTVNGREAWTMYRAAAVGDIDLVRSLIDADPTLLNIQKWYQFPVHMAVRNGHAELVRIMLEAGADPGLSHFLYASWQTLLDIAREREFDEVLEVLETELTTRYNYHRDFRELRDAIKNRDRHAVDTVLSTKPHLAIASDEFGANAVHWAALTRQTALIDRFIDLGADVNAYRAGGDTPLHLSIDGDYWFGKEGMMDRAICNAWVVTGYLLARGADYFMTIACALGDQERVKEILANDPGAANRLDSARNSPLHFAAREGHTHIVSLLLDAGADPNQMEALTTGGRALFEAAAGNDLDTVRLLLEHGAEPNIYVDSCGIPLTIVAHHHPDNCGAMQDLLRSYGAEDISWMTQVEERVRKLKADIDAAFDVEMIKQVIDNGVEEDVNLLLERNPDAFSTLDVEGIISLPEAPEAARRIIEAGMDVNRRDWASRTMLWYHAGQGHAEIVALLLDAGADIDAQDAIEGRTPLAYAAAGGHEGVVRLLLERGADPLSAAGPWATPIRCAEQAGHKEIVKILRKANTNK